MPQRQTQREQAIQLLQAQGIARLSEFRNAGITAATLCRMAEAGEVVRLSRGLYQLPDAPLHANHSLAEAAKRVPNGVVCLVSALAYHELTDQLPRAVWMAIGTKGWMPKTESPPMRFVRFTDSFLADDVMTVPIELVPVKNLRRCQDDRRLLPASPERRPDGRTGGPAGGTSAEKGQPRRDRPARRTWRSRHGGPPVSRGAHREWLGRSGISGPRFAPASLGSARRRARISIWS